MPFRSAKQERFMFAEHPAIAKRWVAEEKAKHQPVVQAADLDLYKKQIADAHREMTRPADKKYADADIFANARQQLAAAPTTPVGQAQPPTSFGLQVAQPGAAPPPQGLVDLRAQAANPFALRAQAANQATPYSLLGFDAEDQRQLRQQAHDEDWVVAAEKNSKTPTLAKSTDVDPAKLTTSAANGNAGGATTTSSYDSSLAPPARAVSLAARETPTIDPARIAQIDADQRQIISAQNQFGVAQDQAVRAQGQAQQAKADLFAQQQADMQRRAQERDAYLQRQEQHIRELSDDVAKEKIDPYKDKSALNRVFMGISAGLGGFTAGFRGTPNYAMQEINQQLNREMEIQREGIERKKGQISDEQGLLASAYRRFGNMEQAEAAARAVGLQQWDAEQQAYAARTGDPQIMAKSRMLSAQMKLDADKQMASLYRYSPAQTVQVGGVSAAQLKQVGELAAKYQELAASNGHELSPEDARRRAAATLGLTSGSGYAPIAKAGKTGPGTTPQIADQIAVGKQAIANLDALRESDGSLPGTGIVSRNMPGWAEGVRGTNARQVDGALWTLGETLAHLNGQRGQEAIEANVKAIRGNGSQDDLDAGIARVQRLMDAREKGGPVTDDTVKVTPEADEE